MKIIVDVMGADNGCAELTRGACLAAKELGVSVLLVGDRREIEPAAAGAEGVEILDVPEFVTMDDDHFCVKGAKSGSSMVRAMRLLHDGGGDACVTAGNTGAAITAATLYAKRIRGVRRAALAPILPFGEHGVMLLDSGANAECTPEYLLQFAMMGSVYARRVMGISGEPRVKLLNIGAEETKGDTLRLESFALLRAAGEAGRLNFAGNIEARGVPFGEADVVVADGFSGNVLLKAMEGTGLLFIKTMKDALSSGFFSKLGGLLVRGKLKPLKKQLDYRQIGGSPLLGISAPVIKAHGSTNAFAFRNAIGLACDCVKSGVVEEMTRDLQKQV